MQVVCTTFYIKAIFAKL